MTSKQMTALTKELLKQISSEIAEEYVQHSMKATAEANDARALKEDRVFYNGVHEGLRRMRESSLETLKQYINA
jgi:hypothetical protein